MYQIYSQKKELGLSPDHKQVLRATSIDESGPGTVLQDFEALLTYIRECGPRATDKQRVLSLSTLTEINERLTHPLQLGLKRPQQKSYPPIHGLYLLARASGLTHLVGNTLVVDEEVAQLWADLNPTEQYFTLLEVWLLRGRPEIVGERGFGVAGENFEKWTSFRMRIPDEGLQIADNRDEGERLTYRPGWYNLGLLNLFGLMTVQDTPSEPGAGWRIERIERTSFGDALLALLLTEFFGNWDNVMALGETQPVPFGALQSVIQPYLPAWEHNLCIPEHEFLEGVCIFKVSLGRLWRRIAIPADMTLEALAHAIIKAVEFDYDHLYTFTYRNRLGMVKHVNHPYMDEKPWTDEVRVGDLPLNTGQTVTFVYDFGDWWEFDVKLERIDPVDSSLEGPIVIEEQGESPEQYKSWA